MTASPLEPVSREGALPLSSQQERFWTLHRVWGRTREMELTFAHRIAGAIEAAQLVAAVGEIVRRHEIYRTVYREEDGRPVQRVLPARDVELACEDLTALSPAARAERIAAACARTQHPQIDLAASPCRFELLRTAADEHLLLATFHHIASDLWSARLWRDELAELCAAAGSGRPAALPAVPLQYADYAAWQRGWLDGARIDDGIAFWRPRVTPVPLVLPETLRADEPAPCSHEWQSPEGLVERLDAVAAPARATRSMVALAAFCALVQSWGNREALVSVPLANRLRPQLRHVHGLFMNVVLVRVELAADVATLLRRVRDEVMAGLAHQDVPFFRAMAPGQGPPQRLLFNYFKAPARPPRAIDTPSWWRDVRLGRRQFTAELFLEELPAGRLYGRLDVRAKPGDAGAARLLAERYQAVLEGFTAPAGTSS